MVGTMLRMGRTFAISYDTAATGGVYGKHIYEVTFKEYSTKQVLVCLRSIPHLVSTDSNVPRLPSSSKRCMGRSYGL